MTSITIELPNDFAEALDHFARQDEISVNDLIVQTLAGYLSPERQREFIELRSRGASRGAFLEALSRAPDVEPEECDRLPAGR